VALDQLISLYSKRDLDFRANLQPGQICWTPVCYSNENAEIWRPTQFDYSETQATHFQLVAKPSKAYQEARVIHSPTLEAYEEPTQWGLSSDAWNIVQGQLEYVFNGVFGGSFKAARDALQGK
jgi:hypothetical protein